MRKIILVTFITVDGVICFLAEKHLKFLHHIGLSMRISGPELTLQQSMLFQILLKNTNGVTLIS